MSDQDLGRRGEEVAAQYLEGQGYRVLDRNYRFERNEVDIVCYDPGRGDVRAPGEIVFVEVKTRRAVAFGRPEQAVTSEKQRRVVAASRAYLFEKKLEGAPCRFDVISVMMDDQGHEIVHFRDAFWT